MLRYDGTIWLEVLEDNGKHAVAGNIYGNVVDLPETHPRLCIRGQPDGVLAGFLAKQNMAKGCHFKARVSVPYRPDWWLMEMELREMRPGNPVRVLLTSTDMPRRAVS